MNINSITDNRLFWKIVCLLYSGNHISKRSKSRFLEKKNLTNDEKSAKTFNNFSENVVKTLNIEKDGSILLETGNETDPVAIAIEKYIKFRSTLRVRRLIKNPWEFYFAPYRRRFYLKRNSKFRFKESCPTR